MATCTSCSRPQRFRLRCLISSFALFLNHFRHSCRCVGSAIGLYDFWQSATWGSVQTLPPITYLTVFSYNQKHFTVHSRSVRRLSIAECSKGEVTLKVTLSVTMQSRVKFHSHPAHCLTAPATIHSKGEVTLKVTLKVTLRVTVQSHVKFHSHPAHCLTAPATLHILIRLRSAICIGRSL